MINGVSVFNGGNTSSSGGSSGSALTNSHIFVGNALNQAADVAMSGDVTIDNTGATTIKSSVALAGSPTTTTQSSSDNSTKIATTAMVQAAIAAAVSAGASFRGGYDASSNLFPSTGGSGTGGAIQSGDFWVITVAGTLGGETVAVGSLIFAIVDSPGQTASNWVTVNSDFVVGPASATDAAICIYNGTTGKLIKNTGITVTGVSLDAINAASLNLSGLTVSQFVGTDGSKNLTSLSSANATALLNNFVGDSGSGGTKGLVPAPSTGDATKYLKGDGTWGTVSTTPAFSSITSGTNTSAAMVVGTGSSLAPSGSGTIHATTSDALQTARTIGGTSFDGTANIVPSTIQTVDESSDTTCFLLFGNASGSQTSGQQPKTNSGLTYNSSTNALAATTFTGALSGNASTATALQNARTINGTSFDGTANINIIAPYYTFTDLSGSITGAIATSYLNTSASVYNVTLPATAAKNSRIQLKVAGTGLSALVANTGQTIRFYNSVTSSAGSLTAEAQGAVIEVECTVANTTWLVISSVGQWTVA